MKYLKNWIEIDAATKEAQAKQAKEEAEKKRQFRHDWKIALFNTLGGALAGGLVSLIFWLLQETM